MYLVKVVNLKNLVVLFNEPELSKKISDHYTVYSQVKVLVDADAK